jgi:hypothetical protein
LVALTADEWVRMLVAATVALLVRKMELRMVEY